MILSLLLGLGLRIVNLNQSFWLDETIQVYASKLSLNQFFDQFLPGDFNPPFYYLITRYWIKVFGDGEAVVRLTSVLFGTFSVFILFLILKKLRVMSHELQIIPLLAATSPLLVYYSQEARGYMLAVLAVLVTTLLLINFLENQTWLNAGLLGLGFLFMSMSHYLTLLTLPVYVGYLFYKKAVSKKVISVILIFVAFWIGYLPIFRSQLSVGSGVESTAPVWSEVIGQASLKSGLLLPVKFVIGRISFQPQWLYGLIALGLVAVYWGSAVLSWKEEFKYKWLFWGLLVFPPAAGFLVSFWLPVFSYFRFIFCLPFLYILIGLSPVNDKIKYSFLIINLVLSGIYLFNPQFHRENWKGLADWLSRQNSPPVYVLNEVRFPLEYYYTGKICRFKHYNDSNDCSVGDQVYLVSYGLPIFDPEDRIRKELRAESLRLKAGESFRQVGIEIWKK